MSIIQVGKKAYAPLGNRFYEFPLMKTCEAYLKPNYAKNRWKTYVSKASGYIHKHTAAKRLSFSLTFMPDLHRQGLDRMLSF